MQGSCIQATTIRMKLHSDRSMMADTSWEEAKRCPKCQQPGVEINSISTRSPRTGALARVHTLQCENDLCLWYQTRWIVQTVEGEVVQPRTVGIKSFPALTKMQGTMARDQLRGLRAE